MIRPIMLFTFCLATILLWTNFTTFAANMTVSISNPYVINDGLCSLIEAIDNANADAQTHADCPAGAGADTITLTTTINVTGSTLFAASAVAYGNAGLPEITSDITITGGTIRRTGAVDLRFFVVTAAGTLTLDNIIIRDGRVVGSCPAGGGIACGGAILGFGNLNLSNATFTSNQAIESTTTDFPQGGAIFMNGGTLTATESTFTNNSAEYGGAIASYFGTYTFSESTFSSNTAVSSGGAIYNGTTADLTILSSTFTNNQVTTAPFTFTGGGAIDNAGSNSQLTVMGTTFTGNTSAGVGGAINNFNASDAYISNSTFTGNSATAGGAILNQGSGATLNLYSSTVTGNTATYGAGISNGRFGGQTGIANIINTTISGNNASNDGGGIFSRGNLTLEYSTVNGNTGSDGAGIFVDSFSGQSVSIIGTDISNNIASGVGGGLYYTENPSDSATNSLNLEFSTLDNNRADAGGGLFAEGLYATILHTTISNNTAVGGISSGGGGIFFQDFVAPPNEIFTISNSTISGNTTSGNGGGIYVNVNPSASLVSITNSTITDNNSTSTNTAVADGVHDAQGATSIQDTIIANNGDRDCTAAGITDDGNNIGSDGTCGFTTDNTDPLLGNLADNGGYNLTHALLAGSPAIDNGSGACPATDQRGTGRTNTCDIGAYEFTTVPAIVTFSIDETSIYEDGTTTTATVTINVDNTDPDSQAVILTIPLRVIGSGTGVSIDYSLSNQSSLASATPGQIIPLTFSVAAGGTSSETISFTVVDDLLVEGTEGITLVADVVGGGIISGTNTFNVSIIDNDFNPVIPVDEDDEEDNDNDNEASSSIALVDPAISKIGFLRPDEVGVTGERIQWIITVFNNSGVSARNVVVSDTIRSEMQINSVATSSGTSATNGQTVTITIPEIQSGASVQISIFTTVLDGATVNNTACMVSDSQTTALCATASVISSLPQTGESPYWRTLLLIVGAIVGSLTIGLYILKLTYQHSREHS